MPIPAGGSGYSWPVTLSDARKQLNDTDTQIDAAELQTIVDAVTGIIENLVGPVTATAYEEWYDGGQAQIVLRHYPVQTVVSVSEFSPTAQALLAEPLGSTTTFTGYGYTLEADIGRITRTSGGTPHRFASRVNVAYTAGRATCPAPIYDAALKLVTHMWSDQRGDGAGRAVAGGGGDEYMPPETSHLIPWEVEEALAPYRLAPKVA